MSRVDWSALWLLISSISLAWYASALAMTAFDQVLGAWRGRILLQHFRFPIPLWRYYPIYVFSSALNFVLPTSVGGDLIRISLVRFNQPKSTLSKLTLAALIERLVGVTALLGILTLSAPFASGFPWPARLAAMGAALCGLGALAVLWSYSRLLIVFHHWLARRWPAFWRRQAWTEFFGSFELLKKQPRVWVQLLGLSLISFLVSFSLDWLFFWMVGITLPLSTLFFVMPLTTLLIALPISVGGLGLKEMSLMSLLTVSGVSVGISGSASGGVTTVQIASYSLLLYSSYLIFGGISSLLLPPVTGLDLKKSD